VGALNLLAKCVECGIIYPVMICFFSLVEKYRKCDGNHQYSKANKLSAFDAEH
jgi:hypothetical protein